mmetsp:Transcript_35034/g.73907  ORF Transcript_35034/g.73907 Transcript_35034/m.73907 type:complete len:227 (+) Transcript_35034:639-1319(+)
MPSSAGVSLGSAPGPELSRGWGTEVSRRRWEVGRRPMLESVGGGVDAKGFVASGAFRCGGSGMTSVGGTDTVGGECGVEAGGGVVRATKPWSISSPTPLEKMRDPSKAIASSRSFSGLPPTSSVVPRWEVSASSFAFDLNSAMVLFEAATEVVNSFGMAPGRRSTSFFGAPRTDSPEARVPSAFGIGPFEFSRRRGRRLPNASRSPLSAFVSSFESMSSSLFIIIC